MNTLKITRPSYKECTLNNKVIDSESIIKNKCFHLDILNDDMTVKESKRDSFLIGGVLKLKNTYLCPIWYAIIPLYIRRR